ncbi:MAG: DUF4268 domain-containing protein [Variibacter sp.]
MSAVIPLGSFSNVPLREAWPTEDGNFTPWLAEGEAIALLGETLGLELEIEAVEHWVGPFRADILARVADEPEHRVLVENQFGRTDHGHLGQILTYLAGIDGARTIVWIAEAIQPDHRAAIDWLNTNTAEDFAFFAIEIALWRIAGSPPAPRFNIVAGPNDWTKRVRAAARAVSGENTTRRRHLREGYWSAFGAYLAAQHSTFRMPRSIREPLLRFRIGCSGVSVATGIGIERKRLSVELYIHDDKALFDALHGQRAEIERELGHELVWKRLPERKRARVLLYKEDADSTDEGQWPQQHAWMLATMDKFKTTFVPRVKVMSPPIAAPDDLKDQDADDAVAGITAKAKG